MERRISGHTGLMALFGSPVGHSGSPAMYNYSFQKLGLDYAYVAIDMKEEQMEEALKAMKLFHMKGGNVTMPCKRAAARFADRLSPAARLTGAVNTLVNEDGVLVGHMTDGEGFVDNLKDHGVDIRGKRLVIAGSGGAGTAIQVQCALSGAAAVRICNRKSGSSYGRALETAEKIREAVPDCQTEVFDLEDDERLAKELENCDIFVNATSLGMAPREEESPIRNGSLLRPGLVVADIVYNPVKTRLLREAKEAGCICIGGKGMLLWQGAAAFRLFTGMEMPVEEVKKEFFSEGPEGGGNIFLIGFMGSGKTTIAAELGKRLGIKRLEMDAEIERRQGMAIARIFERFGEPFFRDLETKLVEDLAGEGNLIVSCGGGAVLRRENTALMKESGKVVLLAAKPETIYERVKGSDERPILNGNMTVEYIASLMEKRRAAYEAAADVTVWTDGKSREEICREILRQLGL